LDLYKATIIAASMNEYGTVLNEVKIKCAMDLLLSSYLRWILSYVDKRKERAKREALKQ